MLDIAIIGAGAAGIAAGLKCLEQGVSFQIFEARNRIGGRAETRIFTGQPLDLGAHWMHMAAVNPLIPLGEALGIRLKPAPDAYPYYVNGIRQTAEQTMRLREAWGATEETALTKASAEADLSVADCLPDLGEWTDSIAFNHGLYTGRAVEEISAFDYARVEDSDNRFPVGGYGALVARLGKELPVRLLTRIHEVDWSGDPVRLVTSQGEVLARKVIVTVPVMVLAAGRIRFTPALPQAQSEAIASFLPAAYEHVIVKWPDSPFSDGADQLTLFQGSRTRNISMLCQIEGTDFHYVEIGGALLTGFTGTPEEKQAFSAEVAIAELTRHFGPKATTSLELVHVTDWWNDPLSLGSWSVTPVGKALMREALQVNVAGKIFFAGEATSPSQWGTVGGAWLEGERAIAEAWGLRN